MTDRDDYQSRLGQRLRDIRNQQGMTLQEVEDASGGQWKGVVIGAYERGDRAISAAKLADLASFYGIPVGELLPEPEPRAPEVPEMNSRQIPVGLNLNRLVFDEVSSQLKPISRYATTIQRQRGDYNGRVLTLRSNDVRALSVDGCQRGGVHRAARKRRCPRTCLTDRRRICPGAPMTRLPRALRNPGVSG